MTSSMIFMAQLTKINCQAVIPSSLLQTKWLVRICFRFLSCTQSEIPQDGESYKNPDRCSEPCKITSEIGLNMMGCPISDASPEGDKDIFVLQGIRCS
jgi:hypothetical protein